MEEAEVQTQGKQRHGCLTAYLIVMIVFNAITSLSSFGMFFAGKDAILQNQPDFPLWSLPVMAVLSLVNIGCAVALFQWKKWGFFGCCVTAGIVAVINLIIGINIFTVLLGLTGIAILFGILQIGKDNKGWPQLD